MRILAIRGSDLASLAGPFAVELDAPPLGGSGLFAIAGNTGAGKSSILDALCLALFDRMPRLPEGQGVEVGRREQEAGLRLKSNDVRSILRRGAGEGYAEVDFRGNDGRVYRARWAVRRARGRAEGRLQQQTMELTDLAGGQSLGRTKTEVLEQIQARLGLSFEQFRRSVLLAQGDFAAFLKSRAGERAALLERITGTEIYGALSRAAHLRAAEERQVMTRLQDRLGEHRPLEPEQRRLLQAEHGEAKGELERLTAEQRRLETAHRWHLDLARLEAEQAQARQALERAEAAREQAVPRRKEWRRVSDLQSLRQPLQELDRVVAEKGRAEAELVRLRKEERESREAAEAAARSAGEAEVRLRGAEVALRDVAPQLLRARELDTRIADGDSDLQRLRLEQAGRAADEREALGTLESLEGRRVELDRSMGEAREWLADHAHLATLAEQWEGWSRELERYAEQHRQLAVENTALEAAASRLAVLERERTGQAQALQEARQGLQALEQRRQALERQAAGVDLQALAARREALQAREKEHSGLQLLLGRALEQRSRIEELESSLATQHLTRREEAAAALRLQQDLTGRSGALEEGRAALQRLLVANAESVEALRSGLEDGQPCPVCGALEHPWGMGEKGLLERLLQEQQSRVESQERWLTELRDRLGRARSNAEHAGHRIAELEAARREQQERLEQTLQEWRSTAPSPVRPESPFETGLMERLEQARRETADESEEVKKTEVRGREILSDLEARRREQEVVNEALGRREQALRESDDAIRETGRRREQVQQNRERSAVEMRRLIGILEGPLAGFESWRERLEQDPDAFSEACAGAGSRWRETAERLRDSERLRAELAPKLARAAEQRVRAAADLDRSRGTVAEHQERVERLRKERAGVLEGRSADRVEAELQEAGARATEAARAAQEALAGRRESLAASGRLREAGERGLERCEIELSRVRAGLDDLLQEHAVTEESLRQALVHDRQWLETERQALDALEVGLQQARGLLRERERRVRQQREANPPRELRAQVEALLATSGTILERARDSWAALQGRLEQDDQRRKTSRELQREAEKQGAVCRTWDAMKELIGSADGGKFRSFAQGLTLKLLLAHANVHLRDLARRYQLEPVPGAELELQVIDREMGDEVRSVHSLSGGESFLVSLALALGLASLASERVQVESLFIDEGFGALDAEALDMAIASFDTLYGLGRQVGVISHVPTLVERIGARVQVESRGGGRSRVRVVGL